MVNILDFNPKKLSIEKGCAINDELERIYYVIYEKSPFYLIIDDLKGYFKYSKEKNRKKLEFIIEDQKQAKVYNQIWDKIKEFINSADDANFGFSDYLRDDSVIRFDTLPLDAMVSIYSTKYYYDRFYPQIHLANCIYKKC